MGPLPKPRGSSRRPLVAYTCSTCSRRHRRLTSSHTATPVPYLFLWLLLQSLVPADSYKSARLVPVLAAEASSTTTGYVTPFGGALGGWKLEAPGYTTLLRVYGTKGVQQLHVCTAARRYYDCTTTGEAIANRQNNYAGVCPLHSVQERSQNRSRCDWIRNRAADARVLVTAAVNI